MKYLINYDLKAPGRDYTNFRVALMSAFDSMVICDSCWAVKTSKSAQQITAYLKQYIDSSDVLFVCAIGDTDWDDQNLPYGVRNWLNN